MSSPHARWTIDRAALERLLERLAPEREAAAHEYELLRRKLVDFFGLRAATSPDALADETLDRMARKIGEGEPVNHVRAYLYGVARRVLWEWEKKQTREQTLLREAGPLLAPDPFPVDAEARIECLKACLRQLSPQDRTLVVTYYRCSEHSQRLDQARRLGISYTALKTRVHRVRATLETCRRNCIEAAR